MVIMVLRQLSFLTVLMASTLSAVVQELVSYELNYLEDPNTPSTPQSDAVSIYDPVVQT
jgi:hypothetical protein